MWPPICFDVVSTSGDSALTVTACSMPPTSSWTSIAGLADFDADVVALIPLEPDSCAAIWYSPGVSALMKNEPSAPLTTSRNWPVASFFATTVTPGSTALCASTMRPRSSPVPCCAYLPSARDPGAEDGHRNRETTSHERSFLFECGRA